VDPIPHWNPEIPPWGNPPGNSCNKQPMTLLDEWNLMAKTEDSLCKKNIKQKLGMMKAGIDRVAV